MAPARLCKPVADHTPPRRQQSACFVSWRVSIPEGAEEMDDGNLRMQGDLSLAGLVCRPGSARVSRAGGRRPAAANFWSTSVSRKTVLARLQKNTRDGCATRRMRRAQKKTARGPRQRGSDYRCCIPALAGFVSPPSIAPDGGRTSREDSVRAIGFLSR